MKTVFYLAAFIVILQEGQGYEYGGWKAPTSGSSGYSGSGSSGYSGSGSVGWNQGQGYQNTRYGSQRPMGGYDSGYSGGVNGPIGGSQYMSGDGTNSGYGLTQPLRPVSQYARIADSVGGEGYGGNGDMAYGGSYKGNGGYSNVESEVGKKAPASRGSY